MNIYLDDDTADRRLIALLESVGWRVVIPRQVDLIGAPDSRHLTYCCRHDLVLLSRNHDDFLDLHVLLQTAGGMHPGIVMIRADNDPSRDMTPRGIVAALKRLESSGLELSGQFIVLNQWR